MSNICVVASCNTRRTRNTDKTSVIKCFSFPKDPDLKRQWLHLCQVKEDHNRKVCIKHFKEDDFVDGLKARLMSVQPTRLKKDAVPSLFLSSERITEESKQKQIQNQGEILKKYISKKKRQVQISTTTDDKARLSDSTKGSMEYLSKLVPIAPKGQGVKRGTIIAPKDRSKAPKNRLIAPKNQLIASTDQSLALKNPLIALQQQKTVKESLSPLEEPKKLPIYHKDPAVSSKDLTAPDIIPNMNTQTQQKTLILVSETKKGIPKPGFVEQQKAVKSQVDAGFSLHQLKILQHDNAIYKKRINTLLDSQNKLLARLKELEAEIKSQKEDFIGKVKQAFVNVLSSNQIDNILGIKKHIWWSDEEYSKFLKLLHINKQAYKYIRDVMNYPLPCITNVYKWSTKHDLRRPNTEEIKLKCDENKENGGNYVIDDDQLKIDDVKLEIKNEYADQDMTNVVNNIVYDQGLDGEEYTIKINNVKRDHNVECEKVDYIDDSDDNDNEHSKIDDHVDIDHLKVVDESSDQEDIEIDHNIVEHDSPMNDNDQNDEFYEELIIENDYSDDEVFEELQKNGCNEKDNG